jgi:hypothetical protein
MSHYAKVVSGVVTQVIVAEADFFTTFVDSSPGDWIQTSYNTRANVHYLPNSNTPSGNIALRGNYAGIGHIYDRANDVFYTTSPYPSWQISSNTWTWQAPTPMPTEGGPYQWNEANTSWIHTSTTGA